MRRFPDVDVGVNAVLGAEAFAADKGHLLSHASGGELDINLFPHRRELNRGWSEEGKLFREWNAMPRLILVRFASIEPYMTTTPGSPLSFSTVSWSTTATGGSRSSPTSEFAAGCL